MKNIEKGKRREITFRTSWNKAVTLFRDEFVFLIILKLICLHRKVNSLLPIKECLEFSGTNMGICQTLAIKEKTALRT